MIEYINRHPEKSFMVATPFLSEIERIKDCTGFQFCDPQNYGSGKLDSLNSLLCSGKNIACTHSLFLNTNDETWNFIAQGEYILFLDEVLDVVKPVNDLIDDLSYRLKKESAKFLIDQKLISVDEKGFVRWIGEHHYDDYDFTELERLVRAGNVLCAGGQLFLWMFPPKVFTTFSEIYIMSYLFKGSLFDAYFNIHGFEYELMSAMKTESGYRFRDYVDDRIYRQNLKSLIHICDNPKLNEIGLKPSALSSTWYDNQNKEIICQLKKNLNTYFKGIYKAQHTGASNIMWTTFKPYRDKLCGSGYTFVRLLTKHEQSIKRDDPDSQELAALRCYVPCNARATNTLAERNVLAYLVNRYYNPLLKRLFDDKYSVKLSNDQFALAEMLQWLWRSAIRNGREVWAYIPSYRMRKLLQNWLDGKAV